MSEICKTVDTTNVNVNKQPGLAQAPLIDRGSGGILVIQRALSPSVDELGKIPESGLIIERVTPTSTTDVYSAPFPVTDYESVAVAVNVITANVSATAAKIGLQFSMDGANWYDWDDQQHTAPTTGSLAATKLFKSFSAATTGFKAASIVVGKKFGKYCRVSANSGGAFSLAFDLNIQLL